MIGRPNSLRAATLRDLIVADLRTLDLEDDDGSFLELLQELVPWPAGEEVFSLWWDSGGPGAGAGTERVYRVGGKYVTASSDFGWDGPFDALEDAYGSIFVTGATESIRCSEWDEEEILTRIELVGEPDAVEINGVVWPLEQLEHRVARLKPGNA